MYWVSLIKILPMNILFDQTEAQASYYNGAAEYAQTIFLKMVSELEHYPNVTIYSLYNSNKSFRYPAVAPDKLTQYSHVQSVDYRNKSITEIIEEYKIDLLFVTCTQAFCDLSIGNLNKLPCKVVTVIHDMYVEEMALSQIEYLHYLKHPGRLIYNLLGRIKVRLFSGKYTSRGRLMKNFIETNDTTIIAVSEYTKRSIEYHYPQWASRVRIFASPMKVCTEQSNKIENKELQKLIKNNTKYYLFLSADRITKNGERMMNAFYHFTQQYEQNAVIVTTGYKRSKYSNHIALPFLSSSDIDNACKHCLALLYPSLFEGFGYPPIEVMRYGKPVISSFACSMPEILGDSPTYFAPIYETSIYDALCRFQMKDYKEECDKAQRQYEKIRQHQQTDLEKLTTMLLDGTFIKNNLEA